MQRRCVRASNFTLTEFVFEVANLDRKTFRKPSLRRHRRGTAFLAEYARKAVCRDGIEPRSDAQRHLLARKVCCRGCDLILRVCG